jgi:hypothetical protein
MNTRTKLRASQSAAPVTAVWGVLISLICLDFSDMRTRRHHETLAITGAMRHIPLLQYNNTIIKLTYFDSLLLMIRYS